MLSALLILVQPNYAEDPPGFEKIADVSPDGKFGVRISRIGEFTQLETESLRVNAKGDVRNEYVNPIRWVKPGVLLLEQFDIFRGGNGEDATYGFTARFDEKTGKFRIISKKKIPSKE